MINRPAAHGNPDSPGLLAEHRSSPSSRRRRAIRLSPLAVDAMASWVSLAFESGD
ncbi:hypothetical protein [Sphingobium cupriresistens]|uniref:hypothetical protein n=1 Tax=Sphingobium cupriresistens TaxID=1132417 RepID=UPI001F5D8CA9|nr:hypothetical protein [Sphingobium cupriresistens]